MNKFKKILLGALSILTLGLIAVTGARVNAETITEECNFNGSVSNSFYYGQGSYKNYEYTGTSILPSNSSNVEYTKCAQSGCSFVVENSWTGKILFKNINKGNKTITVNLNDGSKNTKIYDSLMSPYQTDVAVISGDAGTFTISGGSNFGIYEIYVTYEKLVPTSKTFTLNYNANGGIGEMDADTNSEALEATSSSFTVLDNSFSKQGYNFVGWSTSSTATVAEYVAGDTFVASSENSTLYAVWEQDTSDVKYTLNFDANGGTQGTISSIVSDDLPYTTTSHEFTITSSATPTRDNYNFIGWATTSSATEAEYQPNDTYTATSKNTTLYAVWEKQTYIISNEMTIEFNTLNIDEVVISNGQLYSNSALKFGSSTKVEFTTSKDFILTLKTDKDKYSYGIKVDNNNLSFDSTNYEAKIFVKAGKHTIERISSEIRLYSINFTNPLSDNTTASVFSEKNTVGDKLRFVGTITGVTDLASVDKIELILGKNGTLANPINLTKCYTSVEGSSQTCEAADGTYYTIFRLSGIDTLDAGTKISKQLKVTFTDGSTTLSESSEITL